MTRISSTARFVFMLLLALPATALDRPVILSVANDIATNTIIVEGENFGNRPSVRLGAQVLEVKASTATRIDATAPSSLFPGTYVVRVRFENAPGPLGEAYLEVFLGTVQPRGCGYNAPVVQALLVSGAIVGNRVFLEIRVFDPDTAPGCGLPQAFSFESEFVNVPAGSSLRGLNDLFTPYPWFTPDVPGEYTIKYAVTDLMGKTGRGSFTVAVAAAAP